jgi:hypothetical protein
MGQAVDMPHAVVACEETFHHGEKLQQHRLETSAFGAVAHGQEGMLGGLGEDRKRLTSWLVAQRHDHDQGQSGEGTAREIRHGKAAKTHGP